MQVVDWSVNNGFQHALFLLPEADSYVPIGRVFHSDVLVEERLFSWAGRRKDAADFRDCKSEEKMRMTSTIDVFHCKNGKLVIYTSIDSYDT